jgi:hypothetical protein
MATKQTNKSELLQVGDLVRVRETTHDDALPPSRTGLIVEVVAPDPMVGTGIYMVRFGSYNLKFHAMFLEKVS